MGKHRYNYKCAKGECTHTSSALMRDKRESKREFTFTLQKYDTLKKNFFFKQFKSHIFNVVFLDTHFFSTSWDDL